MEDQNRTFTLFTDPPQLLWEFEIDRVSSPTNIGRKWEQRHGSSCFSMPWSPIPPSSTLPSSSLYVYVYNTHPLLFWIILYSYFCFQLIFRYGFSGDDRDLTADPLIVLSFSGLSLYYCYYFWECVFLRVLNLGFIDVCLMSRGFEENSDKIQINTDCRSRKVLSLSLCFCYLGFSNLY